jgi:hypothetical protein
MALAVVLIAAFAAGCTCGGGGGKGRKKGPAVVLVDPEEDRREPVAEVEPNETRESAQALPAARPVAGAIGPATKAGVDQDWFRVTAPTGGSDRLLRAAITGATDLDLTLEAFDEEGVRLVRVNNAQLGGGEVLVNLTVAPGSTTYLRVREARRRKKDVAPTTGPVGRRYQIDFSLGDREEGEEREPNWKAELATPLAPEAEAVGYLGWHTDNDWYLVESTASVPGSRLRVELDGVDDVAAHLAIWQGSKKLQERRGRTGRSVVLANLVLPPTPEGQNAEPLYVVARCGYQANVETRYSLRVLSSVPPMSTEAEPNDAPDSATELRTGTTLAGILADTRDHDLYRIAAGRAMHLKVTAVPPMGLDLALALVDDKGAVVVEADNGKDRTAEVLPAIWVPARGALLRVRAPRRRMVTAASSYHIKVEPVAPRPELDLEREPNDDFEQPTSWTGSRPMTGYLHPKKDVDHFLVQAPGEQINITMTGVPKLSFKLELLQAGVQPGQSGSGAAPLAVGSSTGPGQGASLTATTTPMGRYIVKISETASASDDLRTYQLQMMGESP